MHFRRQVSPNTSVLEKLSHTCTCWWCRTGPSWSKVDNAIHRVNHYPLDTAIGFPNTYPLGSDLSSGLRYPPFEKLVLRSLWIFIRSSKNSCADLKISLKISKRFFTRVKNPTIERLAPEIHGNSTLFLFCLFICLFH